MMRRFCLVLLAFLVSGCTLAPIMSPHSGKSLGKGNWEVAGDLIPSRGISGGYGITDSWDVGFLVEGQLGVVTAMWTKYAFTNENSWNWALYGGLFQGAGIGTTTSGYMIGPIVSYRKGWFEPSLALRYNYVKADFTGYDSEEDDDFLFTPDFLGDIDYDYVQLDIGLTFWTSESFALRVTFKSFLGVGGEVTSSSSLAPGFGMHYQF